MLEKGIMASGSDRISNGENLTQGGEIFPDHLVANDFGALQNYGHIILYNIYNP